MNSWELKFSRKSIKQLNDLPKEVRERIFKKLQQTKENPLSYFERLKGRQDYKLRIGDYRVMADLNKTEKKIEVTKAGHRKNIYKNL